MRNFQKCLEISKKFSIFAPRKKLKFYLASFLVYVYKEIKVRCRAFVGIDE